MQPITKFIVVEVKIKMCKNCIPVETLSTQTPWNYIAVGVLYHVNNKSSCMQQTHNCSSDNY